MITKSEERRIHDRLGREEARTVTAIRVRPGLEAVLVDVSSGGMLVDTRHRLLPGTSVELHVLTEDRRSAIRARVTRCAIVRLEASSVHYRAAVAFERVQPWIVERDTGGYAIPRTETETVHA